LRPLGVTHFSNLYQKHKTLLTVVCNVNNAIQARLHLLDFPLVFLYSIQSCCFTLTRTQTQTSPLHSLTPCTCTIKHNPSWKKRTQLLLPTHSLTNTPVFPSIDRNEPGSQFTKQLLEKEINLPLAESDTHC
jgi:hypothetical protein